MAMSRNPASVLMTGLVFSLICGISHRPVSAEEARAANPEPLRCIAFSPYVDGYNPNTGPHPPRSIIRKLLDRIKRQTPFRCILTYGTLHGLDAVFPEAQARGLKVIAVLWLDGDASVNERSIQAGIRAARKYPDTIIRLSCGSEVRTRHGNAGDRATKDCLKRLRAARVPQPISAIDTWWEVCERSWPCRKNLLFASLDWIGINVYPWWENKFSGLFPCTAAEDAAEFVAARMEDVMEAYPGKEVILTEFGWPSGPPGYSEINRFTGQSCGVAGSAQQALVLRQTLDILDRRDGSGAVFEAFQERWKVQEGVVGPFWGICRGTPPYRCRSLKE